MMPISIILPVGPGTETGYLLETLLSIAHDISPYDEIVIVLDRFPERELVSVIDKIDIKNDQIHIPSSSHVTGLCQALNLGCSSAKHEIIARMDSDDLIIRGRLDAHRQAFKNNPKLAIHSVSCLGFSADGSTRLLDTSRNTDEFISRLAFKSRGLTIIHPASAFRKKLFTKCGGYRQQFYPSEDSDLWMRLIATGESEHSSIVGLKYRIHSASISSTQRSQNFIARLAALAFNWGSHPLIHSPEDALEFTRCDRLVGFACKVRSARSGQSFMTRLFSSFAERIAALSIIIRTRVSPPFASR